MRNKILCTNSGMTLVEVVIYAALLSFLLSGFIQTAYTIHFENIRLSNEIIEAGD